MVKIKLSLYYYLITIVNISILIVSLKLHSAPLTQASTTHKNTQGKNTHSHSDKNCLSQKRQLSILNIKDLSSSRIDIYQGGLQV